MKQYLSTLHTRSHKHKKNFALLVSGTFTVLIFALWSFVHFSTVDADATAAAANALTPVTGAEAPSPKDDASSALSPFSSLKETFSNSIDSFKKVYGQAKDGLKQVDLNQDYTQVRDRALTHQAGQ